MRNRIKQLIQGCLGLRRQRRRPSGLIALRATHWTKSIVPPTHCAASSTSSCTAPGNVFFTQRRKVRSKDAKERSSLPPLRFLCAFARNRLLVSERLTHCNA